MNEPNFSELANSEGGTLRIIRGNDDERETKSKKRDYHSSHNYHRSDVAVKIVTERELFDLVNFERIFQVLTNYVRPNNGSYSVAHSIVDKKRNELVKKNGAHARELIHHQILGTLRDHMHGMSSTENLNGDICDDYQIPVLLSHNPELFQKAVTNRIENRLERDRLIKLDSVSGRALYPQW